MKCCFCKKDAGEFGNNAQPIMDGRCCDSCNNGVVLPIRILQATKSPLLQSINEMQRIENEWKLKKIIEKTAKRECLLCSINLDEEIGTGKWHIPLCKKHRLQELDKISSEVLK